MQNFKKIYQLNTLIYLLIFGFAVLVQAPQVTHAKKDSPVSVDVTLTPMGSFTATSARVFGTAVKKGDAYMAKNIRIPVNMLKTGIGLRDKHLKEKLEFKKHRNIIAHKAQAKGNKGQAQIEIKGVKKVIKFDLKDLGNSKAQATFNLSLKDFGIKGISYKGVGVQDKVSVTVILPYKNLAAKK